MQVITVSEFGGPEVLKVTEAPLPQPGPGEVLVRVLAAGVGPWDAALRRGGWTGSLPYVPGGEFAGVVVGDTGADAAFDDGAPVYGYPGLTGCYAQYLTCPVERLAPIPEELSAVEEAGAPIDALTAEQGLTDVLGVGPGDRILVTAGGDNASPPTTSWLIRSRQPGSVSARWCNNAVGTIIDVTPRWTTRRSRTAPSMRSAEVTRVPPVNSAGHIS